MKQIALRTNNTRAKQRPPLRVRQANSALLVALGFKKPAPLPKPPAQQKIGHHRRVAQSHSSAARLAGEQSGAKNQPTANKTPASNGRPTTGNLPLDKSRPAAPDAPEGKTVPEAKTAPEGKTTFSAEQKPEVKTPAAPAEKLSQEKELPAPASPPEAKKQPVSRYLPPSKTTSEQKAPPARNVPEKPPEKNSSGSSTPGLNGVSTNGKAPGTNGANGTNNLNGSNGKHNGAGGNGAGANGSSSRSAPPRSLLFRPSAFSTMPTVRSIPPRAAGPAQPPAGTPQSSEKQPDEQRGPFTPNGKPAASEIPPANPLPPNLNGSKSPETNIHQSIPQTTSPTARTPTLDQLLKQNADLPDQAAVLGVCEDGLPMLLDMRDPAPGALVVVGDEREKQLVILRNAVASLAGRNSPRAVQFLVLSCEPGVWKSWVKEHGYERHCLAVESADGEIVRDWIVQLADWTEQRRLGKSSGPSVLMIMDTLSFLPQLNFDIRLNFDWMAKEGPQARIWPLAVISTDLAKALSGRRMLRAFQTRVLGYANNPADYIPLAGLDEQTASGFGQRSTFSVKVGETWLRFKLPG